MTKNNRSEEEIIDITPLLEDKSLNFDLITEWNKFLSQKIMESCALPKEYITGLDHNPIKNIPE